MTTKTTNPLTGLAGRALPFDIAAPGAADAFHDGSALAAELLVLLVRVESLGNWPEQDRQNMTRAALCGFLSPLLPLVADALELFNDDDRAGLLSGLIDDIAYGAAHALDLMGGKEAA